MKLRSAEKHQVSSQPAVIQCMACSEAKDLNCNTGNMSLSDSNIAFSEKFDVYLVNKFNQVS